jgi:hypothetical protein
MGVPSDMAEAMRTWHPARQGTRVRVVGPLQVNGMSVWRVFPIGRGGLPGAQLGPDCLSYPEAERRATDFLDGKVSVWMGGRRFARKAL